MSEGSSGRLSIFVSEPNEAHRSYVTEQLKAYNRSHLSTEDSTVPLEIYISDGGGRVVGGLVGRTVWGWLEISVLFIEARLRGQGLGTELMSQAEDEARRRGCVAARLSTWDFQALGFYQRLGYVPFGRLDDYPPGHTVHYLRKGLTDLEVPHDEKV